MATAIRRYDLSRALIALKIAAAGVVLAAVALQIRPALILRSLSAGDPLPILGALLLVAPNLGLQYLKWRLLARTLREDLTAGEILGSLFAGFSGGLITPARVGELAGRALSLRSVDRPQAVGLALADKISSLIITLAAGICALFAILIGRGLVSIYFWYPLLILLLVFLYGAAWLVLHPPIVRRMVGLLPSERPLRRRLTGMFDAFERLRPAQMAAQLSLSALFYATFLAQYVLLVRAFAPVPLAEAVVAVAAALFSKTVIPPVTFGELGIREGSAVYFLTLFGHPGAAAFNASILVFTMNILFPSLIGLFFIPRISLGERERGA